MSAADLLPPNATKFERAASAVDARLLAADTEAIRRERDPQRCDAAFVPFLGWERSVHHWTGVEATDRASIASSFGDHVAYGAPPALEQELSLDLGWTIRVEEFWEFPGGVWPYFRVVAVLAADVVAEPPTPGAIYAAALRRKNVRDMPLIVYEASETAPLGIGAALKVAATIHVLPYDPTPRIPGAVVYGAMLHVIGQINVRPYGT